MSEFHLAIQLLCFNDSTVGFFFVFNFQGKTTIILRCLERYALNF